MSQLSGFNGSRLSSFIGSQLSVRGIGERIFTQLVTESMAWEISANVKHFRTVNGIPDASPVFDGPITGIVPNFQFYKMYLAMFSRTVSDLPITMRVGGYVGSIDPNNDTLDPLMHPGFSRWLNDVGNPIDAGADFDFTDNPVGAGVGMGVDASSVIMATTNFAFTNLNGGLVVSPTGWLTHGAVLKSNVIPLDEDRWRIALYLPNPGIGGLFGGDTGAPDFFPIRSRIELVVRYELTA